MKHGEKPLRPGAGAPVVRSHVDEWSAFDGTASPRMLPELSAEGGRGGVAAFSCKLLASVETSGRRAVPVEE